MRKTELISVAMVLLALAQSAAAVRNFASDRKIINTKAESYFSGCLKEQWIDQRLDHFRWGNTTTTWKQRLMICDRYWKRDAKGNRGPIFFYGNFKLLQCLTVVVSPPPPSLSFLGGTLPLLG